MRSWYHAWDHAQRLRAEDAEAERREAQAEAERLMWRMNQDQLITLLSKLTNEHPEAALKIAKEITGA